jgi:predicted ATP-dependent protease
MIFEAIAAIELANQAINGIKELAGHVTSVGQMGKQLTQLADAHEELEKDAAEGDMEAFWALEDIKRKEYEIKQMFIYAGRPGLWEDYQTFIRNRKELKRKQEEREKAKRLAKKKAIKNGLIYTCALLAGLLTVGLGIWLLLAIVAVKGK